MPISGVAGGPRLAKICRQVVRRGRKGDGAASRLRAPIWWWRTCRAAIGHGPAPFIARLPAIDTAPEGPGTTTPRPVRSASGLSSCSRTKYFAAINANSARGPAALPPWIAQLVTPGGFSRAGCLVPACPGCKVLVVVCSCALTRSRVGIGAFGAPARQFPTWECLLPSDGGGPSSALEWPESVVEKLDSLDLPVSVRA